jgi:UDP-N-acetylglucosamine 2-epimerase
LRNETEWTEALKGNCNFLVDLDSSDGKNISKNIIDVFINSQKPIFRSNIFGDGNASKEIIKILENDV